MRFSKYDFDDFIAVKEHRATVEQLAKKYETSILAVTRAMRRANVYVKKTRVLMRTPYKTQVFNSISKCANACGVSAPTIAKAVKGQYSKILNELEIEVEVIEPDYAEEEYDD